MSFHIQNLAWDVEVRSNQKIVLLALSHLAVQSTGECTPTVRKLAYMCGLSESSVRDQLKHLMDDGLVEHAMVEGAVGYRVKLPVETK
ncbi:helix-turn-helix domain-containing protein [Burkholderia gladioli]|uniref:helix-turn-helix domain-containing protein n=1 Tax=Burkholderia gladioli TaxID=28095 RepID=UPI00163EC862|nr:helix-turn-helix domain-containing protein [Burkholderia gladioli]